MNLHAHSGRPLERIDVAAVEAGELGLDDIRISREGLLAQAEVAAASGSPQLAANLRRAAELTALETTEVLAIYEALRPHRSSHSALTTMADDLASRGLPACAALVREAAEVYRRRNLST